MLKQAIYEHIKSFPGASFASLTRKVQGFKGDKEMILSEQHPNTILWQHISHEAVVALGDLVHEGKIKQVPLSVMAYMVDGIVLKLPLVKSSRVYKYSHWLPMGFTCL